MFRKRCFTRQKPVFEYSSKYSLFCHICALFDRLTCHMAGTWSTITRDVILYVMGVPGTPVDRKICRSDPQSKHAIANKCCHLANKDEKHFRLLPNYVDVFFSPETILTTELCFSLWIEIFPNPRRSKCPPRRMEIRPIREKGRNVSRSVSHD